MKSFFADVCFLNATDAVAARDALELAGYTVEFTDLFDPEGSPAVFVNVWHAGDVDRHGEVRAIIERFPCDMSWGVVGWAPTEFPF